MKAASKAFLKALEKSRENGGPRPGCVRKGPKQAKQSGPKKLDVGFLGPDSVKPQWRKDREASWEMLFQKNCSEFAVYLKKETADLIEAALIEGYENCGEDPECVWAEPLALLRAARLPR